MSDQEMIIRIAIIFILLMVSAFFSGSETALTATSRATMRTLAQNGNKRARSVVDLTENRERLIGAILLGNNLVNILASALATSVVVEKIPGDQGIAFATLVMTILVVLFSEVMPKTAAIARPEAFAMLVGGFMRWIVFLFAPITHLMQVIVRSALQAFGLDVSRTKAVLSANEELRGAIDLHHEEGRVEKHARDIIRGALDLEDIRLEEVMIHRKNIEMIDLDRSPREIIQAVMASRFTRIPLYRDNPDNIVGVIHAKDLLREIWRADGKVSRVDFMKAVRAPYYVPETTTLFEQLDAFKRTRQHFALVVDEYGAIMGLVTMEDILEEIVGEIEDEHDKPVEGIRPQPDGSVHVDGNVTIRDLNRLLDWQLPDEEAVTIAGLVIHEAQTIPEVGQVFSFHNFRFQILGRRRNQITSLKIIPLETPSNATSTRKDPITTDKNPDNKPTTDKSPNG